MAELTLERNISSSGGGIQPQLFGLTMIDYDFSAVAHTICGQTSAEAKLYTQYCLLCGGEALYMP